MNNTTKKAMTSDKVVAYYTSQLDELYNNMYKDDFTWLKGAGGIFRGLPPHH